MPIMNQMPPGGAPPPRPGADPAAQARMQAMMAQRAGGAPPPPGGAPPMMPDGSKPPPPPGMNMQAALQARQGQQAAMQPGMPRPQMDEGMASRFAQRSPAGPPPQFRTMGGPPPSGGAKPMSPGGAFGMQPRRPSPGAAPWAQTKQPGMTGQAPAFAGNTGGMQRMRSGSR